MYVLEVLHAVPAAGPLGRHLLLTTVLPGCLFRVVQSSMYKVSFDLYTVTSPARLSAGGGLR